MSGSHQTGSSDALSLPPGKTWLDLPMPSDEALCSQGRGAFTERVLRARRQERQLDAKLARLAGALPAAVLEQFAAPTPSATFSEDTARRVGAKRRQRWAETLARHVAPAPCNELSDRTLAALAPDPTLSRTVGRTRRQRTWGVPAHWALLATAAAVLLWDGEDQPAPPRTSIDDIYQASASLEGNRDRRRGAERSLRHLLNGSPDGDRYENSRHRVSFTPPGGWRRDRHLSVVSFGARWSAPDGSRVQLQGLPPPPGVAAWTKTAADLWIEQKLLTDGLRLVDEQPADVIAPWRAGAKGAPERSMKLRAMSASSPATRRRRLLHVQLHDDLLLILDGDSATAASEDAVLSARGTISRTR